MKSNTMNSFPGEKENRILIVQQINRAYRTPLLKRLSEQTGINLTMIHGTNSPVQAGDVGISIATGPMPFRTIAAPISGLRCKGREVLWFGKVLELLKKESFDIIIADHYTRLLSIWPMQSIQRKRKAGFILWGIGFHQHPTPYLDKFRKRLADRTDALLLYSENEKQRYVKMGVPPEKCFVTQNTVDIEGIDAGIATVTEDNISQCRKILGSQSGPILMHIGRLAQNKRIDLLLNVLPALKNEWPDIRLVLIGEGPELPKLKQLARDLSLSNEVHFLGAITDHKVLAPWMAICDLVVAPAQIGLLAPMTLVYDRSLVISDLKEHHGPEVQAFVPGETGLTYKFGDINDLARSISNLLRNPEKRKQCAANGNIRVHEMMGTERMLDAFLSAIHYVSGNISN
jgi:glycosyltransferase involved in cell wall biosynthesis